jgi:hypothetical protein
MAMPRKPRSPRESAGGEYRFKIDAYTPETMPMARLSEYMRALSEILGEPSAVHFRRLEKSSTVVVSKVDREAAPKVRQRVAALRRGDAPKDISAAYGEINKLLRADNAIGVLCEDEPRGVIIRFPGREEISEEFPAIRQPGSVDGVVIGIRGKDETIHITLQSDGRQISGFVTNKTLAKQLGTRLFEPVRLYGRGKWSRDAEGNWHLEEFRVDTFDGLADVPLSSALDELRSIPTEWDEKSYSNLDLIRHGPTDKRNGGH